jgi:hypothetical protein
MKRNAIEINIKFSEFIKQYLIAKKNKLKYVNAIKDSDTVYFEAGNIQNGFFAETVDFDLNRKDLINFKNEIIDRYLIKFDEYYNNDNECYDFQII